MRKKFPKFPICFEGGQISERVFVAKIELWRLRIVFPSPQVFFSLSKSNKNKKSKIKGIKFSLVFSRWLTYWVWRRLPWIVIRWSNVTLRRKFLVHVHTLIFGFEDFKKIPVSNLSFSFLLLFRADLLFWNLKNWATLEKLKVIQRG